MRIHSKPRTLDVWSISLISAQARTKALALKAATARMHWEAVCEASYAQEHVSITPAMMQYANYQINPEGVTQVANKKKHDTKHRRAEACADLQEIVKSTVDLIAEAEALEAKKEYLSAEDVIGRCLEVCVKMLKRSTELVKNGDMDRAARSQVATELKARINLCEERMNKLAQVRVRTHMQEGRLRRRSGMSMIHAPPEGLHGGGGGGGGGPASDGTESDDEDRDGASGGSGSPRRHHHGHHHHHHHHHHKKGGGHHHGHHHGHHAHAEGGGGGDGASSGGSPEPSPSKRLTVNSHCARLDALATKNVNRGVNAKRRITKFVTLRAGKG